MTEDAPSPKGGWVAIGFGWLGGWKYLSPKIRSKRFHKWCVFFGLFFHALTGNCLFCVNSWIWAPLCDLCESLFLPRWCWMFGFSLKDQLTLKDGSCRNLGATTSGDNSSFFKSTVWYGEWELCKPWCGDFNCSVNHEVVVSGLHTLMLNLD